MKNSKNIKYTLMLLVAVCAVVSIVYAQQQRDAETTKNESKDSCPLAQKNKLHEDCPLMRESNTESNFENKNNANNDDHFAAVNKHGEKEMGFSQTKTTHHFLLTKDGGAIQVEVNDRKDKASRDKIRSHLKSIALAFTSNDFETPFAVYGQIPPGVLKMKEFSKNIKYEYEETESGGTVRITTNNHEALTAVYEFLRFQIEDHRTGDSLDVKNYSYQGQCLMVAVRARSGMWS